MSNLWMRASSDTISLKKISHWKICVVPKSRNTYSLWIFVILLALSVSWTRYFLETLGSMSTTTVCAIAFMCNSTNNNTEGSKNQFTQFQAHESEYKTFVGFRSKGKIVCERSYTEVCCFASKNHLRQIDFTHLEEKWRTALRYLKHNSMRNI